RKQFRYKLRQVTVNGQRDVACSGKRSVLIEQIERNRIRIRLGIRKSNADVRYPPLDLHINQAVVDRGRFENARLRTEIGSNERLKNRIGGEINATGKCQTNPAAAKRLISTENDSCDAISRNRERKRRSDRRAIRGCGERISVIVENIGCSEYAARN